MIAARSHSYLLKSTPDNRGSCTGIGSEQTESVRCNDRSFCIAAFTLRFGSQVVENPVSQLSEKGMLRIALALPLLAVLATSSHAAPMVQQIEISPLVEQVAGGCGPGRWRGPYGGCRSTPYYGPLARRLVSAAAASGAVHGLPSRLLARPLGSLPQYALSRSASVRRLEALRPESPFGGFSFFRAGTMSTLVEGEDAPGAGSRQSAHQRRRGGVVPRRPRAASDCAPAPLPRVSPTSRSRTTARAFPRSTSRA